MATVSYSFRPIVSSAPLSDYSWVFQNSPSATALAGGGWLTGYEVYTTAVEGRTVNEDGSLRSASDLNITPQGPSARHLEVAGLSGGNAVAVYTFDDGGWRIHAQRLDANGNHIGNDFSVHADNVALGHADVAALNDGGFVVTWERQTLANDHDINAAIFNADGTQRQFLNGFATASDETDPHVTGLANGDFVVTWTKAVAGKTEIWFQRFAAGGNALGAAQVADNIGSINTSPEITALHDGGFAMVYADNGWSGNDTDITLAIFNANGSLRQYVHASPPAPGLNETSPTVTTLTNGYIAVGWTANDAIVTTNVSIFDPNGNLVVNDPQAFALWSDHLALAAGQGSHMLGAFYDIPSQHVQYTTVDFVRTTTGNAANETLIGDELDDVIIGGKGNDTITGGGGHNTFVFAIGDGQDTILDFTPGAGSRIDLTGRSDVHSFGYVLGHTHQVGADTVIQFGGDTIILKNVDETSLSYNDFLLNDTRPYDFNGDRTSDVMWHSSGNGAVAEWLIQNGSVSQINLNHDMPGWQAQAGDFNGDGTTDLLWNNGSGVLGLWQMKNGAIQQTIAVNHDMPGWAAISGDFNGDGTTDLLWNNGSGVLGLWQMQNGAIQQTIAVNHDMPGWTALAGDFNGDGTADLLWSNGNGVLGLWQMQNGAIQQTIALNHDMPGWAAISGDFNGDGTTDLLWNNGNGVLGLWQMQNGEVQQTIAINHDMPGWTALSGDFNGDGTDDLLWTNDTTGATEVWQMQDNAIQQVIALNHDMPGWLGIV